MPDEYISETMRDYLMQVYRLEEASGKPYVSTSELADALMVSAPAVNRMVTKMRDMGLMHHERYQGIALTEDGEREALKALRRLRIVETFLVKVMGFGWHEVTKDAEDMSVGLGERLLVRMWEMAEKPARCPHGSPIPNAEGAVIELPDRPLAGAEHERDYVITRVTTREPDRLEYLAALGLKPDTPFRLLHAAPFNGPMQLQIKSEYRIIGYNLAEVLRVKAINKPS